MEIKVNCQEINTEPDITDLLAKILESYGNSDYSENLFIGVFAKPYGKYSGKNPEEQEQPFQSFCDKRFAGHPHSYSWRWWGKRSEDLIEKLEKEGYKIIKIEGDKISD